MKTDQSIEDYLEAILVLGAGGGDVHQIAVAKRLGVSQPAVTKAVRKLKELGYIETEGMHIILTAAGRARADAVYARHCDIREFLILLGVGAAEAECDACRMEHVIGDATYAAIKKYLNGQSKRLEQ